MTDESRGEADSAAHHSHEGQSRYYNRGCAVKSGGAAHNASIKTEAPRFNKVHNLVRRVPVPQNPLPNLKAGDDVWHPTFGKGLLLEVRGHGERTEVTVRFDKVGTKHLSLAWAPIEEYRGQDDVW